MANNSSKSNGDVPFGIDLNDYDDNDAVAFGTVIHKVGKVKTVIKQMCRAHGPLDLHLANEIKASLGTSNWWFDPGSDGEILKTSGKGWEKGKIKLEITLKFYPDEPEIEEVKQAAPSLDDLRRTMSD